MTAGMTVLKIGAWLLVKSLNILYIPLFICRIFQKPIACPPIDDEMLMMSGTRLAEKIRNKQIKCEDAIRTYVSRIQEVNPIFNAVIEDRFEQAIEDAKRVDQLLLTESEESLKDKYPLLGVPLTVKGSIAVAGLRHTAGVVSRKNTIAKYDAVTVRRAREAGAIPLLVSNVPELCMNWETRNKLVGVTKNPYDTRRSPGGSSGGEAALLCSASSVIGIGSDIAGSLRLPSHCCGVWGHKPSPGAVSYEGHYPSCASHKEWTSAFTLGPMARYVEDLRLLLGVIIEEEYRDILRLEEPVDLGKIKVYYVKSFESLLIDKTNENCVKAVEKVVQHFKNNSRKVNSDLLKQATELATVHLLCIEKVENPFDENYAKSFGELFKLLTFRSDCELTAILYGVVKYLHGKLPRSQIFDNKAKLEKLRETFVKMLGDNGVFVMPSYSMEAQRHGDYLRKALNHGYMSIFNCLGFPVTNCPVYFTKERLPVGVQVVAAPNCDRLTLAVAQEIEKVFGGWRPPNMANMI